MRFAVGNAQDIGARPEQQDAFGFSDPRDETFVSHGGFLGVVADGMGGLSHGSEASHVAVRAFLRSYELKSPGESIREALRRSLLEANRAVVSLAEKAGSADGVGTTLAAAVLHQNELHWISAGDSRIYLLHGNCLTRITSDHVYAKKLNDEVAEGKITRAQAHSNSEREALTSYLGQPDLEETDSNARPFPLLVADRVILCSDGFYHALSKSEIVQAFKGKMQAACEKLVKQALAKHRSKQDNLTVIALAGLDLAVQKDQSSRRPISTLAWLTAAVILALLSFSIGVFCERRYGANSGGAPTQLVPASTQNSPDATSVGPTGQEPGTTGDTEPDASGDLGTVPEDQEKAPADATKSKPPSGGSVPPNLTENGKEQSKPPANPNPKPDDSAPAPH